jgi:murein DD-endopeptidase MepM/ murein hydrolase activator NlpD
MIESQTEYPAPEAGPHESLAWVRYLSRSVKTKVLGRISALQEGLRQEVDADFWIRARKWLSRDEWRPRIVGPRLVGLWNWASGRAKDGPLLNRFALHLVVIFLALGVVSLNRVTLPAIDIRLPTPTPAPSLGEHTVASASSRGGGRLTSSSATLVQSPVLHTIIPDRQTVEIITYTVQPNDNVWSIATGFGLQAQTIIWSNPALEKAPDLLSVGQVLTILPVDGIYYTVQAGDTVDKIAKEFQTEAARITSYELNGLQEPYLLTAGQKLVIPGGRKKIVPSNYYPGIAVGNPPKGAPVGSGRLAWPTRGMLSQGFWEGHPAIDIANRTGTPILAADAGYVVQVGQFTWGYGNQVLIDHGNGLLTRYAHLQSILVKAGQSVDKQQQIGTMGSTGRSTGPHLHFEVYRDGIRRNPLGFLP